MTECFPSKHFCFLFLLVALLCSRAISAEKEFKRLDPHGKDGIDLKNISLKKNTNCLVCHNTSQKSGKIITLSNIPERCISCHNKLPHSGLAEHLGKDLAPLRAGLKGKIDCLSCHRPHRSKLTVKKFKKPEELFHRKEQSFVLKKRRALSLPKGLIETRTENPMLEKNCLDCHRMENMP